MESSLMGAVYAVLKEQLIGFNVLYLICLAELLPMFMYSIVLEIEKNAFNYENELDAYGLLLDMQFHF